MVPVFKKRVEVDTQTAAKTVQVRHLEKHFSDKGSQSIKKTKLISCRSSNVGDCSTIR